MTLPAPFETSASSARDTAPEASTSRNTHWAALDGLRGLAVLAVLAYHFGVPGFGGGFLGVDVFFVISGCVVTVSWRRMRRAGPAARQFYRRRAVRLLPNLFAFLIVVTVWNTWHDRTLLTQANALLLAAAAQVVNIATAFSEPAVTTSSHLWSLSIEWQFYLLLPVLLMPLWRRPSSTRPRVGIVVGLAVLSMVLRPLLAIGADVEPWRIYHWTITRLDGLALGVLAGLLLERGSRPARRWSANLAALTVVLLIVVTPNWWSKPQMSLYLSITGVGVASFVVVRALTSGTASAPLERFLSSAPLRWVGERSYSLYLWHFFIGVVVVGGGSEAWQGPAVFAVQVVASFAVALAAYELVEKPMRGRLSATRVGVDGAPTTAG